MRGLPSWGEHGGPSDPADQDTEDVDENQRHDETHGPAPCSLNTSIPKSSDHHHEQPVEQNTDRVHLSHGEGYGSIALHPLHPLCTEHHTTFGCHLLERSTDGFVCVLGLHFHNLLDGYADLVRLRQAVSS